MIHAQIKNNVVINTIVTDENTPLELFSKGFDYLIRVDQMDPRPGIGWAYDGAIFTAPPPPPPDYEEDDSGS